MSETSRKHDQESDPQPKTLNRYIHRIYGPAIAVGCILIVAFVLTHPTTREEVKPEDLNYNATNAERTNYFVRTPTADNPDLANENIEGMRTVIDTLEPRITSLEEKISGLKQANKTNWEKQRNEVVEAWKKLDTTFDALSDNIPTG